ncbi:MAG: hypothetical protein AB7H93_09910 [Vicinamibacterales bacterium]
MLTLATTVAVLLAATPCSLVTPAEAATVTGTAPTTVLNYGPEKDPETKASVTWCVMSGAPIGLLVYVDTYASPAAALATVTPAHITSLMDSDVKVEPEAGLGDRAFWAHNDTSARMVVIRGATVMSILIGGVDLTKAGQKRAATKALAAAALKRL